ncbi:hypothetical protein Pint_25054 [Pistacia integerrima]|uniref:Uncharacterized protein n=1 Tax=Pistacia integerrima TaxID=434235 RepID=A0ACC0YI96_9ROSI|nr:hypothetical protein Pint_25054 [Pistacia integerrima]
MFRLKNLELDVMMEDLIMALVGLRREAYLQMDRVNQRREEQLQQVRDGKRNRALSEADFDDEDDPDMSLR